MFDQRVTVGYDLTPGRYGVCQACDRPVSASGLLSQSLVAGIRFGACHDERTGAQRAGYAKRHRQ